MKNTGLTSFSFHGLTSMLSRPWCMNRGNANEINTLRFSALNRKT
jgi:hypothetical protein